MPNTDIDYDIVQRQLGILMTNSVAFMSNLYDLFVSTTPMDITVRVWTSENTFETLVIPNRAKGNIPSQYGEGSPEGEVDGNYGSMYIDQSTGSVYIKLTLDGPDGWAKLITAADLIAHNMDQSAHNGVLAQVDGDPDQTFEAADPVLETDVVNKRSLDTLLGGLENLDVLLNTEADKRNVVDAINETVEMIAYDKACAVNGPKNALTNKAALMYIEIDENNNNRLVVSSPLVCVSAEGKKKTYSTDVTFNLETLIYGTYSIFMDLTNDEVVMIEGDYIMSSTTPNFMAPGDSWLDLGSAPYTIKTLQDDFSFVNHDDYAYLGQIVWEG